MNVNLIIKKKIIVYYGGNIMNIIDKYFELSDLAGNNEESFLELVNLFSENAVVQPIGHEAINGKKNITEFYKAFFKRNVITKHVWKTEIINEIYEATWAVAVIRNTGEVAALQGTDIAMLDSDGYIVNLEVLMKN